MKFHLIYYRNFNHLFINKCLIRLTTIFSAMAATRIFLRMRLPQNDMVVAWCPWSLGRLPQSFSFTLGMGGFLGILGIQRGP